MTHSGQPVRRGYVRLGSQLILSSMAAATFCALFGIWWNSAIVTRIGDGGFFQHLKGRLVGALKKRV